MSIEQKQYWYIQNRSCNIPIAKESSITTQNIGTCKSSYTKGYVYN